MNQSLPKELEEKLDKVLIDFTVATYREDYYEEAKQGIRELLSTAINLAKIEARMECMMGSEDYTGGCNPIKGNATAEDSLKALNKEKL